MDYSGLTENDLRECFAPDKTIEPILLFEEYERGEPFFNYSIFLKGKTVIMARDNNRYVFPYDDFYRRYLNQRYYPIAFQQFKKYLRIKKLRMIDNG
jgi:hypothetical protein